MIVRDGDCCLQLRAIIKHHGICNNHVDLGLKNTTGNRRILTSVLRRRFLQPLSVVAFDWVEVQI